MRPALIFSLFAVAAPSFGWGPEGHSLVARIAESQLTPAAKARILEILGPGKTMASVASWADDARRSRNETGPWHYVDIPIDKGHLDMQRDCAKGACVVSAIARFREAVRNPATPPDQRREALMFLIHFVGDMHQPLHSSDNQDKGGNGVPVLFHDRKTNLHSLWDSGLLSRLAPEEQLFPTYCQEAERRHKKWAKGTVSEWAEESHKTAQKVVYRKLPKAVAGAPVPIDGAYEAAAAPVVREQIERAGARLAWMLNSDLR
jgi:hypothetical protein